MAKVFKRKYRNGEFSSTYFFKATIDGKRRNDIYNVICSEEELFTLLRSNQGDYEDVGALAYYACEDLSDLWLDEEYVESEYHREMMDTWEKNFYGKD